MFGAEYGDIEIFVKTASDEKRIRKIVEDLPHYNKWLLEEADIDACTENFQAIIFVVYFERKSFKMTFIHNIYKYFEISGD